MMRALLLGSAIYFLKCVGNRVLNFDFIILCSRRLYGEFRYCCIKDENLHEEETKPNFKIRLTEF